MQRRNSSTSKTNANDFVKSDDENPSVKNMGRPWFTSSAIALVLSAVVYANVGSWSSRDEVYPSAQYVRVDPADYAVLGSIPRRSDSFGSYFNPTNTSPPFFQIYDDAFLDILGPSASIRAIASNDTFAFAHEAPIWAPKSNEIFFASNDGGALGMSDIDHNSQVAKISLDDIQRAIAAAGSDGEVNINITKLDLADTVQMTNGGTGPYHGSLLLATSGRGDHASSLVLVNTEAPYNATVLLDNFFGRQFNSLNDIKVHSSGNIFFTDVTYGWLNHFRPQPLMPNQVYRLDPIKRSIRVVADGFVRPNGIAFSEDGAIAYISDTGAGGGFLGLNQTDPATIYAYDVDQRNQMFSNRRVFAYVDAGVPDGIQVDKAGNVYSGCGDGVQVWDSDGTLLGKFFLGMTSANMVFAGKGKLVIMAETKIFLAEIAAEGLELNVA